MSRDILSDFPENRKFRKREIKTIHNLFRDCRVHRQPTNFLERKKKNKKNKWKADQTAEKGNFNAQYLG